MDQVLLILILMRIQIEMILSTEVLINWEAKALRNVNKNKKLVYNN